MTRTAHKKVSPSRKKQNAQSLLASQLFKLWLAIETALTSEAAEWHEKTSHQEVVIKAKRRAYTAYLEHQERVDNDEVSK